MRIQSKFILPVVTILVLSIAGGLLVLDRMMVGTMEKQEESVEQFADQIVRQKARSKMEEVYQNIDRFGQRALEQAALFSRSPVVQEAFEVALSGDIEDPHDPRSQEGREMLRRELAPVIEGYKEVTGAKEFKLHFHLPSGLSLARLWRDGWQTKVDGRKVDISDDISSFRRTVVEINGGDHAPLTGIEVGRGGFAIRGVAPVTGPDGEHLGSCEMLYPFSALLEAIHSSDDGLQFAVYMDAALLPVAKSLQNPSEYPVLENKYVLTAATDAEVTNPLLTVDLLQKGMDGGFRQNQGSHFVDAFPVRDYSGNPVGVMVLAYDLSAITQMKAEMEDQADAALSGIRNRLGGGSLALLLAITGVIVLVARKVTAPLNRAVIVTEAIARGDLSEQIDQVGRDEVGTVMTALQTMVESLKEKADLAEQIAAGNLLVDVHLASEKDQLGRALKTMAENLNETLGQIQSGGEQMAAGSAQVADSSQSLSQGATEQASSLEEISASINELSSQTRQNAENAAQANQLSIQTKTAAEGGNNQMQAMVSAMAEINQASEDISRIIKVIDEIAFQTNLLALNAAVEAARAGAHGKGFAVVAEEVRNLAARSAKAAKETAQLIEGSVQKAQNGAQIADQTSVALAEIVSGITKVSDLVGEIAAASNEQAQGIGQINTGLGQIDQVTQQNTANAEESAAAAEELSSQAEHLRQLIARFQLRHGVDFSSDRSKAQPPQRKLSAPKPKSESSAASHMPPTPRIALDDDEFGRY